MIDTHAHLNDSPYWENIDSIVVESKKAGLTGIIVASSNLTDSRRSIELAKRFPNYLYACIGIHPQQTDPDNSDSIQAQIDQLNQLITDNQSLITSIGECGLDYSPAPPGEKDRTKENQNMLFKSQVDLSIKYNLPLIIHARQANDEIIEILQSYTPTLSANNCPRGVFHCYTGGKKRIKRILSLPGEWYFGFDGNITYEDGLSTVIKEVPTDRIIIETDSPFLAPIPYRGQTNKPGYLPHIQQKINSIFETDLTATILNNSKRLFSLK